MCNMETIVKHQYFLTHSISVDRFCSVRLAHLEYQPRSHRPDDCGGLYVAPIISGIKAQGMLALYSTTNGDPIILGNIEDGELTWYDDIEHVVDSLKKAEWNHRPDGEGYSYLVESEVDAINLEDSCTAPQR